MKMMERLKWNWHLLHYFVYLWQKTVYRLLDYILPTTYIIKIPAVNRYLQKRHGVDDVKGYISKITDGDEKAGLNIMLAGIFMGCFLVMLEFSIFNLFQALIGKSLIQYIYPNPPILAIFAIIFLIPQGVINYFVLFKNDRYLIYFKEFKKLPKELKRLYGWRCFFAALSFFLILVGSFVVLSYRLR